MSQRGNEDNDTPKRCSVNGLQWGRLMNGAVEYPLVRGVDVVVVELSCFSLILVFCAV